MRPSKGEMLNRIAKLEDDNCFMSSRISELRRNLNKLESIVEELAKKQGYYLVHKNGYYLEPIMTKPEEPYGN